MIDKENLVDELDIIKGRLRDMIDEIKERETDLISCQSKFEQMREYKQYLEAKLAWTSLQT
jgi:hypothetical protein